MAVGFGVTTVAGLEGAAGAGAAAAGACAATPLEMLAGTIQSTTLPTLEAGGTAPGTTGGRPLLVVEYWRGSSPADAVAMTRGFGADVETAGNSSHALAPRTKARPTNGDNARCITNPRDGYMGGRRRSVTRRVAGSLGARRLRRGTRRGRCRRSLRGRGWGGRARNGGGKAGLAPCGCPRRLEPARRCGSGTCCTSR